MGSDKYKDVILGNLAQLKGGRWFLALTTSWAPGPTELGQSPSPVTWNWLRSVHGCPQTGCLSVRGPRHQAQVAAVTSKMSLGQWFEEAISEKPA